MRCDLLAWQRDARRFFAALQEKHARFAGWLKFGLLLVVFVAIALAGQSRLAGQVPAQFAKHTTVVVKQSTNVPGPGGGAAKRLGDSIVETQVRSDGIRVQFWDSNNKPIEVAAAQGLAIVKIEGEARRYRLDLLPQNETLMVATKDFAYALGKQMQVEVLITGINLPNLNRSKVRYQEFLTLGMTDDDVKARAIKRQGICPVTGLPLGSQGEPVAVHLGDRTVYLCCKSCEAVAQANPAAYSAGKPSVIVTTTNESDKVAIAKQARCPVMDEPLGGMGPVVKLLVGKRPLYLCCKGCIKKVRSDPQKYLAMIEEPAGFVELDTATNNSPEHSAIAFAMQEEVRPGVFKVSDADLSFLEAQKTCPVMDEPLDAMGGPYKVKASDRVIYICCPGCAKKIAAEPQKYISKLSKQGINAPLFR